MHIKHTIQASLMTLLLAGSSAAMAGKEGVSFYGGLGLMGMAPGDSAGLKYDTAPGGSIFIGIEEDGWALEYAGMSTIAADTSAANEEYTLQGGVASLGYRTLETSGGLYFLISAGVADFDVTYSNPGVADETNVVDGNVVSIGMGLRLDRTERIELNYSYMNMTETDVTNTEFTFDTHMVSLRYIWGGTPYDPRF